MGCSHDCDDVCTQRVYDSVMRVQRSCDAKNKRTVAISGRLDCLICDSLDSRRGGGHLDSSSPNGVVAEMSGV